MDVNQLYPLMWEAYAEKRIVPLFNTYYKIITEREPSFKDNHYLCIDRWIENYQRYNVAKFTNEESIINGLADTLEELLK